MLLAAEGVQLEFTADALSEMTRVAEDLNRSLDNIGARRLHAVLERVVEDVSFSAPELVAAERQRREQQEGQQHEGQGQEGVTEAVQEGDKVMVKYVIDKAHVERQLSALMQKQDLTKYIL